MKRGLIIGIAFVVILLIILGVYFYSQNPKVKEPSAANCLKAGEIDQSPAALGKVRGKCCSGLTEVPDFPIPSTGNLTCDELSAAGSNLICSACGNGICESEWENRCNCPEDCK